ncbi:MAG TPA: hypothetical protein VGG24_17720 [Paraburkholderia sp.]
MGITLPHPTIVPYAAHLMLVCLALLAVLCAPETVHPASRPKLQFQRIALPREVRDAFIPAALAGFAGFAVVGFFAVVVPQLISGLFGYHNSILIGAIVFLLFAGSAVGQIVQGRITAQHRLSARCPPKRRAEVASSYFVVLYIALSLPVIGLGLAVQRIGIAHATSLFALLTTLTVLAALWLIVHRQRRTIGSPMGQ